MSTERGHSKSELERARDRIAAEIQKRLPNRNSPLLVALDGGSGSGKSALALLIAEEFSATLIQSDDFFAAEIPDAEWDLRSPEAKAHDAIDWRRLRREALEPLLAGNSARWHALDFEGGKGPAGRYAMRADFEERTPATVIVLDGIYSTRAELGDLVHLSVLVDAPVDVRHARLSAREEKSFLEQWHVRWDAAEEYYLTHMRPRSSFDLVVTTFAG